MVRLGLDMDLLGCCSALALRSLAMAPTVVCHFLPLLMSIVACVQSLLSVVGVWAAVVRTI